MALKKLLSSHSCYKNNSHSQQKNQAIEKVNTKEKMSHSFPIQRKQPQDFNVYCDLEGGCLNCQPRKNNSLDIATKSVGGG